METTDKNQNKQEVIGGLELALDIAKKADDVAFVGLLKADDESHIFITMSIKDYTAHLTALMIDVPEYVMATEVALDSAKVFRVMNRIKEDSREQ